MGLQQFIRDMRDAERQDAEARRKHKKQEAVARLIFETDEALVAEYMAFVARSRARLAGQLVA